jgi:hypothetical protein
VLDGTIIGTVREISNPGSTYKALQQADDAKCRSLGFTPGTEVYGNCRLQIEQIRATHAAAEARTSAAQNAGKVYARDECIGPVIMDRCEGTIAPTGAYRPTCHGQWINGQCTGPMF